MCNNAVLLSLSTEMRSESQNCAEYVIRRTHYGISTPKWASWEWRNGFVSQTECAIIHVGAFVRKTAMVEWVMVYDRFSLLSSRHNIVYRLSVIINSASTQWPRDSRLVCPLQFHRSPKAVAPTHLAYTIEFRFAISVPNTDSSSSTRQSEGK